MHSCLGAVKTSMLVIQRAQEAITATLLAKQSDCTIKETLSSLLDCYIHILTDGKIQYRRHRLLSGNSCVEVLRLTNCSRAVKPLGQSWSSYCSVF